MDYNGGSFHPGPVPDVTARIPNRLAMAQLALARPAVCRPSNANRVVTHD
jgi:hypothetical protein